MQANDETIQAIETIREYQADIDKTKAGIKVKRERLTEIKEGKNAFAELEEAQTVLNAAKEKLRASLLTDAEYNDLMEDVANDRQSLKDQQEILSQHIAFYWKQTDERQVPMNETGEARDIVITGKLGASGQYQTNMFAGNESN